MIDATSYAELLQEVQALRKTVEALTVEINARHRITLHPVHTLPFLGQSVTIVAKVTNDLGTPRVDIPVTFVATWGRLRTADGYTFEQGNTVTARTGVDGTVRVTLMSPTSEDLWDVQQDALETMLRLLDPDAGTPHDTEASLQEMARQYRWEANIQFRRAVDIYFRDFRHSLLDTINFRDYMQTWAYFDSTVIAYVREGEPKDTLATSVQGTATLTLRFKDWLGPWLQTYLELSGSESSLGEDLQSVKQQSKEAGVLINGVYDRIRDFVTSQRGLAGEYIGQKVAETSIRDFLDSGIDDLPVDTRVSLFPALEVVSSTIATTGVNVLKGLGQARADLRQELNTKIGQIDTKSISALKERVEGLESQFSEKIDRSELNNLLVNSVAFAEFQVQINALLESKVDTATFTQFQTNMSALLANKVDIPIFTQFQTELNNSLKNKVDSVTFSEFSITSKRDMDALQEQVEKFQPQLAGKVDRADFDRGLASKLDTTRFERFQAQVDDSLKNKVDTATFTQFQTDVNKSLERKVDSTTFNEFSNTVNRNMGALKEQVEKFQPQLAGKVDRTDFDRGLASKLDTTRFEEFQTQINDSLKSKVDTVTFNRFQTDVNNSLKNKVDIVTFTQFKTDLSKTIDEKMNTVTFTSFQTEVMNSLDNKVNTDTFSQFQNNVNISLRSKVNSATFNQLSQTINSQMGTLQNKIDRLPPDIFRLNP
ncbi:hypothetical protein U27_05598 [Candidatus Vecturithrix granuli]|uniref:Uncharacterized protein n=1 Tax=Vecturithrix granuli TaxID=1499967 RepID=A0A081C219_VECG1|nr:hypothetical protein U27_05598 [Candidatus Vecturithrix granuli]